MMIGLQNGTGVPMCKPTWKTWEQVLSSTVMPITTFMAASPVQHCHVISTPIYNTHILPCNHYYQYMKVRTFQGGYNTCSSWAFLRVAAARSKISRVARAC
jgi:hypothetical protein